jgi:hypothetical protein
MIGLILLNGLKWVPTWTSHIGCIKGCLDYLGIDESLKWIFGGTGHAFIINIGSDSCPSGPTAWKTSMLSHLGRNLGYNIDGVWAHKKMPNFKEKQKQGWNHIREAIDRGHPCYGWELGIPEFQVILGYDEMGYYYLDTIRNEKQGPKPWDSLGETAIGVIELYSVSPRKPSLVNKILFEMIKFVQRQVNGEYKMPGYFAGPEAFSIWANGILDGKADLGGIGYNAKVWGECRYHAVGFLNEAKERYGRDFGLI